MPTYAANIRGVDIGGWLYYDASKVTIVVTIKGQRATARDFMFVDNDSRKMARVHAKNLWRSAVLAVLGGVLAKFRAELSCNFTATLHRPAGNGGRMRLRKMSLGCSTKNQFGSSKNSPKPFGNRTVLNPESVPIFQ